MDSSSLSQAVNSLHIETEPAALYAACVLISELAEKAPTLVFIYLSQILDDSGTFQDSTLEDRQGSKLWVALRDARPEIREAATRATSACLTHVIAKRDSQLRIRWYQLIYERSMASLESSSTDAAHGSLCVLAELVDACQGQGLTQQQLGRAFDTVWRLRDSRHLHCRVGLLALLPRLVAAAPSDLASDWLPQNAAHLLSSLHAGPELRAAAFLALGRMAIGVGTAFVEHVPAVVQECSDALLAVSVSKGRSLSRPPVACTEALACLRLLAEAHGAAIEQHLARVLPSLFHTGLSSSLASTLGTLAVHVPSLVPELQDRLLDAVCKVLTRCSFAEWIELPTNDQSNQGGRTPVVGLALTNCALDEISDHGGRVVEGGTSLQAQVTLSLQTLGSFEMVGCELLSFVRECVALYIDDVRPPVRSAAAVTCCRLLASAFTGGMAVAHYHDHSCDSEGRAQPYLLRTQHADVHYHQVAGTSSVALEYTSGTVVCVHTGGNGRGGTDASWADTIGRLAMVDTVLERIVIAGVADAEADVRHAVLSALSPAFDVPLAQTGHGELLLMALSDETAKARELAIILLGRMTDLAPAHLLPALRTHLFDLLTEIKHSSSALRKEDAAHLLGRLVYATPALTRPYATSILHVLQPQLRESACALASLGELAVIAGSAVRPFMPQLLPQLLPLLLDHASSYKRRTALHALSQLLRATGYPSGASDENIQSAPAPSTLLLSTLLGMLGSEQESSTRLELLRALGTLGAPDPSHQMQLQLQRQRTAAAGVSVGLPHSSELSDELGSKDLEDNPIEPSHPDFYPSMALRALTRILRDASLSAHHSMVVHAMVGILRSLGPSKCLPFLPAVMPLLLHTSYTADPVLQEVAIQHLGQLISITGLHLRGYIGPLIALAREHLDSHSTIQMHCISVLEHLCAAMGEEFQQHLAPLIPKLLSILLSDRTDSRQPTLNVLHALEVFEQNLQGHLHLVIPAVRAKAFTHVQPHTQ